MSEWLETESKRRGITVDELRALLSKASKAADKTKTGFAVMPKARLAKVSSKGGVSTRENRKNGVE